MKRKNAELHRTTGSANSVSELNIFRIPAFIKAWNIILAKIIRKRRNVVTLAKKMF